MTALNRFAFNGYLLRAAGIDDLALAAQWTSEDKCHAGVISPAFWLEQRLEIDSMILSDGKGPLFFCKVVVRSVPRSCSAPLEGWMPFQLRGLQEETIKEALAISVVQKTAEIFIQFMPIKTEEDRERTRGGLMHGFPWLQRVLALDNVERIFFDTEDEKLIAFCRKRLGFQVDESFKPGRGTRLDATLSLTA